MSSGALAKASITNTDSGERIEFQFNPTEYSFSKAVNWKDAKERGQNVPKLEFTGGEPIQLTLKLFFDTRETGEDVRKRYTNAIWNLALVSTAKVDPKTKKGRPPVCEFQWGESGGKGWHFKAVVTNISQNFTMFLENGTPVRATLEVTLKQASDPDSYPFQNPTSGGVAGYQTHVLRQGESLHLIAAQEYGDPQQWRYIAAVNNVENPLRLQPGTVLQLPPLPNQ
jgi:nucleoid-associated protein YgaU